MKKNYKFLIAIVIIVIVVISYYFPTLSAEEVLPNLGNTEKVYVSMARGEDGDTKLYENIPIEDSQLLTSFSNIIGDVQYRRVTKRDLLNAYQFYYFNINFNDKSGVSGNYSFLVNEQGYISVYGNGINGEKHYKVHDDEGEKVFNQLKQLVVDSNIPIVKDNEIKATAAPIDHDYEFTYLEEMPEDKVEKYNAFLKDGNLQHLTEFTPEQMVLIFMNLILQHNVEGLYALIYNNGHLPSLEEFKDEYYIYSSIFDEDYLKYRFYDSIGVVEETKDTEEVVVKIDMIYGTTTHSVAYGLKKENNVWKLDLYHIVEKAKKENE
jgi:hypothetical protein